MDDGRLDADPGLSSLVPGPCSLVPRPRQRLPPDPLGQSLGEDPAHRAGVGNRLLGQHAGLGGPTGIQGDFSPIAANQSL